MPPLLRTIKQIPLEELIEFPGNPRRGDVAALKESLQVNEQFEPIVVQASTRFVLAGNHRVVAARELGWKKIAAVVIDVDEEQARRIALSSNRLAELGGYDDELLVAQLRALAEVDALDGTGFRPSDVDDALARLAATNGSALTSRGQREHRDPTKKELVLIYSAEQLDQIEVFLGIVGKAEGTDGPSEIVFNALRDKAHHLNA